MLLLNSVTLVELFEVRKAVEVELAGLAAERASQEQIAVIQDALEKQSANLDNPLAFLVEDLNFHNAIAQAAHNVLFTAILESLSHLMTEGRRKLLLTEQDLSKSFHNHQRIYQEIQVHNKTGARGAMFDHLDRVYHHWEETQQLNKSTAE
jgi:GntR family transcriptional repressor for pyruvate dehydrogenase complex